MEIERESEIQKAFYSTQTDEMDRGAGGGQSNKYEKRRNPKN